MPPWQRRYLAVCGAVIGYAVAYVLCDFGAWPRMVYAPADRAWMVTAAPGPLDMTYLGLVLWGLAGALVGGGLGAAVGRTVQRELPQMWNNLAGAWALTAVLYAGLYYTWGLWPF